MFEVGDVLEGLMPERVVEDGPPELDGEWVFMTLEFGGVRDLVSFLMHAKIDLIIVSVVMTASGTLLVVFKTRKSGRSVAH